MSERHDVQEAFDGFARAAGFRKKSGSWYRRNAETIALVQLQRSHWGRQSYVNVAWWLLALGDADSPKEHQCHVRTRLASLLTDADQLRLERLLDLDADVADRRGELDEFLRAHLLPLLERTRTLNDLRAPPGDEVLRVALVTGPAQRVLAGDVQRPV